MKPGPGGMPPYIPAHGAELIDKIVSQGPRDPVVIFIINIHERERSLVKHDTQT